MTNWPRHYRCYYCARTGTRRRATMRLFTGTPGYGGITGGWPVCGEHKNAEIERALSTLLTNQAQDWEVEAYAVEVDAYGWPYMSDYPIFRARPKTPALQGTADAKTP